MLSYPYLESSSPGIFTLSMSHMTSISFSLTNIARILGIMVPRIQSHQQALYRVKFLKSNSHHRTLCNTVCSSLNSRQCWPTAVKAVCWT